MSSYGKGQNAVGHLRSGDVHGSNLSFEKLYLQDWLAKALAKNNYKWQSKLQEASLPSVLTGKDVVIQSKSGTGKTLVFCIAILEKINFESNRIQAVVLTPTREIALQIHATLCSLLNSKSQVLLAIGGDSVIAQKRQIYHKKPQIVVGTPGRTLDLAHRGSLGISSTEILVLDEADQLLSVKDFMKGLIAHFDLTYICFRKSIKLKLTQIRHQLKNIRDGMLVEKLQTICTSATFPDDLPRMLAQLKCHEPIMIRSKNVSLQKVYNSILYRPEIEKKRDILLELIESVKFQQCFVFASSHSFAQSASLFLNSKGWANTMLSGSLDQRDRTQAWEQLVDKETTILVATDLACRGLDSHHADLIIHVDPSKDNANMSHRVGRSGRFGGHGESIQIAVNDEDLEKYKDFAKFMNYDEVTHRDQAKLVKIVNKRLESENKIKEQEKEHFKEEEIVETTTIEVAKSPEIHSQELIDAGASADLIKNVRKEKLSELEEEKYVPTIEESTPHNESIAESLSSPKPGPIRKPSRTSKKLDFENPPKKRSQTIRIPPIWETLGVPRPGKHLENTVVADTEVFLDSIDKMNDEEFSEWRRTVKPRSEKIFDERRVEISASESESEFSSSSEEDEDDVEDVKNQKIPGMVENRIYL